ncbi:hypothetical protein HYPSUDRAFT_142005 [Hypholoma sublateritium FD-334 SS-4]|uniref:Uncharacterized protein n=1 Tax=Hypholoma sublateritium (strain FD-334 SS-4) TaxID=945553 RepID=A0A0D2L1K3_HYPSF|nr:hypothetical protein HYPSUDRAFT_142005 [Hypholoma sublateritium FD-334 SS-4]
MSFLSSILSTAYDYLSPPASPHHPPVSIPVSREPSSLPTPLKDRLDAACQSPTSTLSHLSPNSMRRELDISKHDLARAQVDSTQLKERCKMLEKTLKETRELLRAREAELEKMRRERDRERAMAERRRSDVGPNYQTQQTNGTRQGGGSLDTRMSSADLAREMHGNRMHDGQPRHTPSPSRNSSSSTSASTSLSASSAQGTNHEEDRARFRSTETYMTRIDSWSGAQVLQAVHDINSEILQFSASATEMCTFLPAPASPANPRLAQVLQDTTARIGPSMSRILATRDHAQDPLLVQLALQGCVSLCIARALNSFCIGFPSKSDAVLAQIYSSMHRAEPQPTSARWRALTHQHIHTIYPTLTDYSVGELTDTILRWCTDIFLLANCQSSLPPPTPAAQLRSMYADQIRRISRAVMRLASVTREEIMSTSFEVTIADPSGDFMGREMVDAFGEYGESRGKVLATMELGLKCITRVSHGVGRIVGGEDGEAAFEQRLLLQPKVVLESVLEVLDR